MRFEIVTGMSGAGKSTVLKFLEDLGYFCIDNLPPLLIPRFAEVCLKAGENIDKVAIGIDIRGGKLFSDFFKGIEEVREKYNYEINILFLDATDNVLVNRYKETRRAHPLEKDGADVMSAIAVERELLQEVKLKANYSIDTSQILTRELREQIIEFYQKDHSFKLMITVLSFGFKNGLPPDADLVYDVRFLPNPFYEAELKEKTGNDQEVKDFVFSFDASHEFLAKANDMNRFLIPNYIKEGKNKLVIAIGCTGGKHRSVALSCEVFNFLQSCGHSVIIRHRDINKG